MAPITLIPVTAAFVLAFTMQVSAQRPAPLVPTALVEDVKSASAGVEFMDYVGNRQVIKLGPQDVLVLSYLKSCEHETITGGTVTVGNERSNVQGGQVVRATVPCNGGKMRLSAEQASQSAASSFRLQSADIPQLVFGRTPVVQLPRALAKDQRTLVVERTDQRGERYSLDIDDAIVAARFYDLTRANVRLTPGATYEASVGRHKVTFRIDADAKSDPGPLVSRLLLFR